MKYSKEAYKKYLKIKGFFHKGPVDNIYFATIQKAGSQYIKNVFDDKRIRNHTKLMTYPQQRYEWDEFQKIFPKGAFVPGLYISYDLYDEIIKPSRYKTFYVMRDPRNIVVSWYHSMLKTHKIMGKVGRHRKDCQRLSFEDGLHYSIDALAIKFMAMRTWKINENDPSLLILKFESLKNDPLFSFKKIFEHCNVIIPEETLQAVLADYTKNKMRKKDLATRKDKAESHYRWKGSDFRDSFNHAHLEHFKQVTGNLVEYLGYEPA